MAKRGRPAKYQDVQTLEAKINEYFSDPEKNAYKETPTITDLVLFLGFVDRQSFYDMENKPEFTCTIKRARSLIEREYESRLQGQNCTGSIFALKNFGWVDRREVEQKVQLDITVTHETVEERLDCLSRN